MRTDGPDGAVHKWTGRSWPDDVDVYHDHAGTRTAVLEYRDGRYVDSTLLCWQQRWLYLIYPQVLAVVRYVAPGGRLGNRLPLGIACDALPWAEPVRPGRLRDIEQQGDRRVEELLLTSSHGHPLAA